MWTWVPATLAKTRLLAAAATKPSLVTTLIVGALSHFTYVALIVLLILAGTGIPIPEDIPLIASGYMCSEDHSPILQIPRYVDVDGDGIKEMVPRRIPKLHWMIVAGMFGVLLGDSIVFTIGKRGIESNNFVARHLRKVMHSKRRERAERHFAKHGNLTIFAGRFMPGFRSIIFAFAGMSKMSYLRFILIDGLAALLSVPFFIWLGYHFAWNIDYMWGQVDRIKHLLLPVFIAGIAIAVLIFVIRRQKRRQVAEPTPPQ